MTSANDIRTGNWVDRRLPAVVRPYARLARLDRPIGTWLLYAPCLWGLALGWQAIGAPATLDDAITMLGFVALFGLGAIVMRGAGCTVNDLWDRKLDAQVSRTADRPIASGAVSPLRALIFLAVQMAIGLAVLLMLNGTCFILGVLVLALVFSYPLAKRVTDWPQAVLGLTFNWGALMGYAAITDTVAWPAIVAYIAGFFWTLGYDTVYAHQDKTDDAIVGVRSSALFLGERTGAALIAFYAITIGLLAFAGWLAELRWFVYPALALAAAHFAWQIRTVDIDEPKRCLAIFKSNRDAGLLIALAFAAG